MSKVLNKIKDDTQAIDSIPKSNIQKKTQDQMGFAGLLGRFTLFYLLNTVALNIVINAIGIRGTDGIGIVVIIVSVMLACNAFAKKNKRYFSQKERVKATLGFSIINIIFQCFFTLLLFIQLSQPISAKAIIIVLAITVLVHTPCIYFCIWSNKKRMIKRGEITG